MPPWGVFPMPLGWLGGNELGGNEGLGMGGSDVVAGGGGWDGGGGSGGWGGADGGGPFGRAGPIFSFSSSGLQKQTSFISHSKK